MAEVNERVEFSRLEDFIALAKKGKDVRMDIKLKKQMMGQKVHPYETVGMSIDIYLLIGAYTFQVEGEIYRLLKVYMFADLENSANAARINKTIANARLQLDYERLKAAGIKFEEKYF